MLIELAPIEELNAYPGPHLTSHVIFVASGYLKQGELYRLGAIVTLFFVVVFMTIGTGWILLVT